MSEAQEASDKSGEGSEKSKALEMELANTRQEVGFLKQSRLKQEELVQSIIKQRDMYKRLVEQGDVKEVLVAYTLVSTIVHSRAPCVHYSSLNTMKIYILLYLSKFKTPHFGGHCYSDAQQL